MHSRGLLDIVAIVKYDHKGSPITQFGDKHEWTRIASILLYDDRTFELLICNQHGKTIASVLGLNSVSVWTKLGEFVNMQLEESN